MQDDSRVNWNFFNSHKRSRISYEERFCTSQLATTPTFPLQGAREGVVLIHHKPISIRIFYEGSSENGGRSGVEEAKKQRS